MDMMITLQWTVRIEGNRASIEEIVRAVEQRLDEAKSSAGRMVLAAYQEQTLQTLCSASGSSAKIRMGRPFGQGAIPASLPSSELSPCRLLEPGPLRAYHRRDGAVSPGPG